MATKGKSARGANVDFDLMKIKSEIASAPKPVDVKAREDFIDRKLRRRVKRAQKKIEAAVDPTVEETVVEETVVEETVVEETVAPKKKRTIKKKKKTT